MALNLNGCKKKLKEFRKVYGTSLGINRIGIFGSVARGENTDDSDIDIVVEQAFFEQDVDLVRYRQSLRPLLKQNIDKEAVYV